MEESKIDKIMKFKREMQRLGLSPIKDEGYVSPLSDANMKVKGAMSSADVTPVNTMVKGAVNADVTPVKNIVKGGVDKIDTKEVRKLISGNSFTSKIDDILKSRAAAKLASGAAGAIKKIPMLGGIVAGLGTLAATGDASAATQSALPLVGEADDLGPTPDSLEAKMENGTITQDELQQLLNRSK